MSSEERLQFHGSPEDGPWYIIRDPDNALRYIIKRDEQGWMGFEYRCNVPPSRATYLRDVLNAHWRGDTNDLEDLFQLQYKREMEIFKRWHEEGKVPEGVWPDYGHTLFMLADERDAAEERAANAERELEILRQDARKGLGLRAYGDD